VPGRVVFAHEDGYIKIYNQLSDGSKGDALTENWLYVQGISLTETPRSVTASRLFAGIGSRVINTGYDRELSIEKYHSDKTNEWDLATTANTDYYIEIVFSDNFIIDPVNDIWEEIEDNWEDCEIVFSEDYSVSQSETWTLKYCRSGGKSLKTQKDGINTITHNWSVGKIE